MSGLIYDAALPAWDPAEDVNIIAEMPAIDQLDPLPMDEGSYDMIPLDAGSAVPSKGLDFNWNAIKVQSKEDFESLSIGQQELLKRMKRGVVFTPNEAAQFVMRFEDPLYQAQLAKSAESQPSLGFDMNVLNVETEEEYNNLTPAQKELYQRKQQGVRFTEQEAAKFVMDFENPENQSKRQKAQAEAEASQKDLLAKEREALQNMRKQMSAIRTMRNTLQQLESHPGMRGAVGMKNLGNFLPGTNEADFKALLEQVSGGVFLQAFQELKGGGPITDLEGQKAEQSIARFNRNQSEQGFKKSLNEFRAFLDDAESRILEGTEQELPQLQRPATGGPVANGAAQPAPAAASSAKSLPLERVVNGRKFRLNQNGKYVPVN